MAIKIDYRGFIEHYFYVRSDRGVLVPFRLNDVQNAYYDTLLGDYGPELQAIRENILKGRRFGLSSLITGIFATDFILSETGEIPGIDSDVYSHKDEETSAHIQRFNLFLDSWMFAMQGGTGLDIENNLGARDAMRKQFLKVDKEGDIIGRQRSAQYHAQTASAKVSGRGGTKQNIHWSEVAFYPNTEIMNAKKLIVGAEKQVPHGFGKIFRETTGNLAADYFAKEYQEGKEGKSLFKSRFIAWYIHKAFTDTAPSDWELPEYYHKLVDEGVANVDQCYRHFVQTKELEDKEELREYPTYDYEAFLYGGNPLFDADALLHFTNLVQKPIKAVEYVQAL
jgi:hypothetical protein